MSKWQENSTITEAIGRASTNLDDLTADIEDVEDGENGDYDVDEALSHIQSVIDTLQSAKQELRKMRNG